MQMRHFPFNWTSVVLKLIFTIFAIWDIAISLLIGPVWYWNIYFTLATMKVVRAFNWTSVVLKLKLWMMWLWASSQPFNWTSVVLKRARGQDEHAGACWLLIGPVWYWNLYTVLTRVARYFLLIGPVWYWNTRTNLSAFWYSAILLIGPVWYWNVFKSDAIVCSYLFF